MTEVEIREWVEGCDIAPDMDVAEFVEQACDLGSDAHRVLLGLLRDEEYPHHRAVVAALRARGMDVFIPPAGGVGMALSGIQPKSRTTPSSTALTYAQLAAPIADRPNPDLFPPRTVTLGGVRASYRENRDRSRRTAKARSVLKERAAHLSRDQADALIDSIWEAEGLSQPPAHIRPTLVDRATGQTSRFEDLRTTADIVHGYVRLGSRIVNLVRHQDRYVAEPGWEPGIHVRTGPASVEVHLDPDAQHLLADLPDDAALVSRSFAAFPVELRPGPDGSLEVWDTVLLKQQTRGRFGLVLASEAAPYQGDLADAVAAGKPLRSRAIRTQGPTGAWRLYLLLPDASS